MKNEGSPPMQSRSRLVLFASENWRDRRSARGIQFGRKGQKEMGIKAEGNEDRVRHVPRSSGRVIMQTRAGSLEGPRCYLYLQHACKRHRTHTRIRE